MNNIWNWYKCAKLKAPSDVKGYEKLTVDDKKILTSYLNNFYNSW